MTYFIAILSAILIARLAHKVTEMRNSNLSAYIFAIFYILVRLIFPDTFGGNGSEIIHVGQLLIILSFFALFSEGDSYSHSTSSGSVGSFITYMMLGISTIFTPFLFWLVPIYLSSQIMLRTLTLKSILAAGLGILVPWLWKWGLTPVIPALIPNTSFLNPNPSIQIPHFSILILFLVYAIGAWNTGRNTHSSKSRTRVVYQVIIFFGFCTLLLLFISSLIHQSLSPNTQPTLYFIALIPTVLLIGKAVDRMI